MNSILRSTAGLLFGTSIALSAAAFEGKVSLAMKGGREAEQVIDYAMKGTRVRLEPKMAEAGGTAMIMNWEKQEMIMLMPEQRMYMVMPMKAPAGAPGAAARASATEQKVEKTGRSEKILGYDCDEYITTDDGKTTEMWITEELGSFAGLGGGNPMAGMMGGGGAPAPASSWENALKNKKGAFPLRVVSRDGKGRETFRLEARQIEPGTLPDSLFAPPAGFQKFAMPAMPGMPAGFGG
ncbi:MAG: hypothetical protein C0518_15480 [Opitutus sp.]|nr:hypothetical protein [Opitutus sp.]